jgi:hypothetical protein
MFTRFLESYYSRALVMERLRCRLIEKYPHGELIVQYGKKPQDVGPDLEDKDSIELVLQLNGQAGSVTIKPCQKNPASISLVIPKSLIENSIVTVLNTGNQHISWNPSNVHFLGINEERLECVRFHFQAPLSEEKESYLQLATESVINNTDHPDEYIMEDSDEDMEPAL